MRASINMKNYRNFFGALYFKPFGTKLTDTHDSGVTADPFVLPLAPRIETITLFCKANESFVRIPISLLPLLCN